MKLSTNIRIFGHLYLGAIRHSLPDPGVRRAVMAEYRAILRRAKDIGAHNMLLSAYTLAAFFIALDRCSGFDAEKNHQLLEDGIRRSRLIVLSLGSADSYLSEKRMKKRQEWSRETHERRYENDWVVDILPGNGEYDLGYDYLECGVCKLCRDEGCPELAKYLCRLDFLLVEMIGLRLTRTTTLAEGGDKCDFRFHRVR